MKSSTSSIRLTGPKTRKPQMNIVVGIVAMLVLSSGWSAQQASAVGVAMAAAGDLDPTFGSGGKATTDFFGQSDVANALAIQPDGKIVAAGVTVSPITSVDFALARYNTDGSLDSSFGAGGKVNTDFSGFLDEAFGVAIQPDGKIVAAGIAQDSRTFVVGFAVARYDIDGNLDTSFGTGGRVFTQVGAGGGAFSVAIQSDGKIVAAGRAVDPNTAVVEFGLVRYNTSGSLDSTFGSQGLVTTDFFGTLSDAFALAIQRDGKIVAVGEALVNLSAENTNEGTVSFEGFAIARYNADGSLDESFGSGGKVTTALGGHNDVAFAVALQPDGKIVAAGDAFHIGGSIDDFGLARYNTDGTLDFSFGLGGTVITDFFGSTDAASSVSIQSDGNIVVAGRAAKSGEGFDFGLARYNTRGILDPTFGVGGKVTTDFFGIDDQANAVAIQPDGRIVAAGSSSAFTDFAVARYEAPPPAIFFNICVQDDSNGNLLQFKSTTGEYVFTNCIKAITLTGIGKITNDPYGCKITLQDSGPIPKQPDRSVLVQVNRCTRVARASILVFSTGSSFSITDSDITNNLCDCPRK